jgi:hypothetical protein
LLRHPDFESLFSNEDLIEFLDGKEFVAPSMAAMAMADLGCRQLDIRHAIDMIKNPSFNLGSKSRTWIANLFAFFGHHLNDLRLHEKIADNITLLPLFPILTRNATATAPFTDHNQLPTKTFKLARLIDGPIYTGFVGGLDYQLGLKAFSVLKFGDGVELTESAKKFISTMGIREAEINDVAECILNFHVQLPYPASDVIPGQSTSITQLEMFNHLKFIFDNFKKLHHLVPQIERHLFVPVVRYNQPSSVDSETLYAHKTIACYYTHPQYTYLPSAFHRLRLWLPKKIAKKLIVLDDSNFPTFGRDLWETFVRTKLHAHDSLRTVYDRDGNVNLSREFLDLFNIISNETFDHTCAPADIINRRVLPLLIELHQKKQLWKNHLQVIKELILPAWAVPLKQAFADTPEIASIVHISDTSDLRRRVAILYNVPDQVLEWLGMDQAFTPASSRRLCEYFEKSKLRDVAVWKKLYAKMIQLRACPLRIYAESEHGQIVFVNLKSLYSGVPTALGVHYPKYLVPQPFRDLDFDSQMKPMDMPTYCQIIYDLIKECDSKLRTNPKHLDLILLCYAECQKIAAAAVAAGSRMRHPRCIALDIHCIKRTFQYAYSDKHRLLVHQDNDVLFEAFGPVLDSKSHNNQGKKKIYPFHYLHNDLAKHHDFVRLLGIPSLSELVEIVPTSKSWRGKFRHFAEGAYETSLPVYEHFGISSRYQATFKALTSQSRQSILGDNDLRKKADVILDNIDFLINNLKVYVCLVQKEYVPVQYTVYDIATLREYEYYLETDEDDQGRFTSAILIVPGGTAAKEHIHQVNPHVIRQIWPWFGGNNTRKVYDPHLKLPKGTDFAAEKQELMPFIVRSIEQTTKLARSEDVCTDEEELLTWTFSSIRSPKINQSHGSRNHSEAHDSEDSSSSGFVVNQPDMESLRVNRSFFPSTGLVPKKSSVIIQSAHTSSSSSSQHPPAQFVVPSSSDPQWPTLPSNKNHSKVIAPPDHHPDCNFSDMFGSFKRVSTFSKSTDAQRKDLLGFQDRLASSRAESVDAFQKMLLQSVLGTTDQSSAFSSSIKNIPTTLAASSSNGHFSEILAIEQDFAIQIGMKAETYVYKYLMHCAANKISFLSHQPNIPGLDQGYPIAGPSCWLSVFRQNVLPDCMDEIDNGAGADFKFETSTGQTVYVEVKGHMMDSPTEFHVSRNEWKTAKSCHTNPNAIYVIVGVCVTRSPARIVYMIEDPVSQLNSEELELEPISFKCKSIQKFALQTPSVVPSGNGKTPKKKVNSPLPSANANKASSSSQPLLAPKSTPAKAPSKSPASAPSNSVTQWSQFSSKITSAAHKKNTSK